jgi:putative peptidoglycan lipid II flippase
MIPVIIGSGAGQISLLVYRMLASGLVEGSISALNFATRLNLLVYGILAVAVANAIYPDLAKAVVYENKNRLINSVSHSLNVILMIIMPIAIGMIILRYPLVRIVYQRGAFDSTDVALTAFALLFYALGLPALSLREVIFNAFYSLQDTLTPMYIGIGTVVLNIVLNLILVRYLEVGGLALATSITFTISFFLLITVLSKKVGSIQSKLIVITGSKIILASLIMGLGVFYFYSWAEQFIINKISEILIFSLSVFLGAILYFIIIKVLKIEEFDFIINLVKSKLAISK